MELVRDAIAAHAPTLADRFWGVMEDGQGNRRERFRAAQVLAKLTPPTDDNTRQRWRPWSEFLATELVTATKTQPQHFSTLLRLYQPLAQLLADPLGRTVGSPEERDQSSREISLLVGFLSDSPQRLTRSCLDASTWQLPLILTALMQQDRAEVISVLKEVSDGGWNATLNSDREARRLATAVALLAAYGDVEQLGTYLRRHPVPTTRAYLIHRLRQVGAPVGLLEQLLAEQSDAGVRSALLQAIGEYPPSAAAAETRRQVALLYAQDPDPGIHGAAEWLLRRWNDQQALERFLSQPPAPTANWRVNGQGQTMVRIDGRTHPAVGRVFEIASMEVSVEQFHRFRPDQWYRPEYSPDPDCPMINVTWYESAAYCSWLTQEEGLADQMCYPPGDGSQEEWLPPADYLKRGGYRLPTRDEWVLACQGDASTARFYGDTDRLMVYYAWFEGVSGQRTHPGGLLKPNHSGLFDLYGNVQEWCDDADGDQRLLSGMSFRFPAAQISSFEFNRLAPKENWNSIGFRVARTVPEPR
jgi:hypothetical protein